MRVWLRTKTKLNLCSYIVGEMIEVFKEIIKSTKYMHIYIFIFIIITNVKMSQRRKRLGTLDIDYYGISISSYILNAMALLVVIF